MRLILVIVGIALLWGGGQGVYTSVFNGDQEVTTCDSFGAADLDAVWVRFDECVADWEEMAYSSYGSSTSPTELFIPLRSPNASPDDATQIVLATKDDELLNLAGAMLRTSETTSEGTLTAIADKLAAASASQSYGGVIQFGIELDDEERREISGLAGNLDDDFVMLEHDAEPSFMASLGMFIGGLLALGLGIVLFARRS